MSPPTPVLLPGTLCDERLWPDEVRRVLPGAVDADLTRDASIAEMAERTLAAVAGPILPLGFSMGGIVALAIAQRAPERLAGLVLLDVNPAADLPERAAARPRQQAAALAGALERIVTDELKPHYLAVANRRDAALLDLVRAMALALGPRVFVQQSEALRTRADLSHVLPALSVPVLIACGAEDRLCPPQWHAAMAETTRSATLRVVAGAGHMLPLERPAVLAQHLSAWLEELPCPAA